MKIPYIKTLATLFLLFLISISMFVIFARATVTADATIPTGGSWITAFPMNFTGSCDGNSSANFDVVLWHDVSGVWKPNITQDNGTGGTGGYINDSQVLNFTTSDQTTFAENNSGYTWGLNCTNTETGEQKFSDNSTFKVDTINPTLPHINLPINLSTTGNTHPSINYTNTSELNFKKYTIQFANATNFASANIIRSQIITSRTTVEVAFEDAVQGDRQYFVRVLAEDDAGNTAHEYVNLTIVTSAPSISIVNYSNIHYLSNNLPAFEIIATHQFIDTCQVFMTNASNSSSTDATGGDATGTPDLTSGFGADTAASWLAIRDFNRSNGTIKLNVSVGLAEGIHLFSFLCNNTGGNITRTANRTIIIDTRAPDPFACFGVLGTNNSKSIDHTPSPVWNRSNDINFANYTLRIDENSDFSSPERIENISGVGSTSTAIDLREFNNTDRDWFFLVNSTDLAGNTLSVGGNCSQISYRTDITNHWLPSGWNLVALMQAGSINASDLGKGIGTNWVTLSRYNSSKEFKNYNNGSSTNEDMLFKKGDVLFINLNQDTYWENQTWDTSTAYTDDDLLNLTNTSGGWNVFGVQNQSGLLTVGLIENGILFSNFVRGLVATGEGAYYYDITNASLPPNSSLGFIVHFNNTADNTRKYNNHPSVRNITFNNGTLLDFGEVGYININQSINGSSNLMILNRSLMRSE